MKGSLLLSHPVPERADETRADRIGATRQCGSRQAARRAFPTTSRVNAGRLVRAGPWGAALAAAVLAVLAAASTPAGAVDFAQVQPALARNGCQNCHGVNENVNGPSFRDIASRYVNKPDERSYLGDKIRKGSSNTWGAAGMPPSEQIDDLDLKTVVEWIASGAPGPAATH